MRSVDTEKIVNEAVGFGFKPVILEKYSKCPASSDSKWQTKYNTIAKEDLVNIAKNRKGSNVGVLCGPPSNILIIDVDIQNGGKEMFEKILTDNKVTLEDFQTPVAITGSLGYHLYFKWELPFTDLRGYLFKNKKIAGIDVKKNGQCVYPGSVYGGCSSSPHKCGGTEEDCKFKGNEYKWIMSPEKYTVKEVPEWLRSYFIFSQENKNEYQKVVLVDEENKVEDFKEEVVSENKLHKRLLVCLDKLSPLATDYCSWRDTVWCIRGLGFGVDDAIYFSKKDPSKFNLENVKDMWDKFDQRVDWNWGWIRNKLREVMTEKNYTTFCSKYFKSSFNEDIFNSDYGLAKIFTKEKKDVVKIVSGTGDGYIWDEKMKLWKTRNDTLIANTISPCLETIINEMIEEISAKNTSLDDKVCKQRIKELNKLRNYVNSVRGVLNIYKKCIDDTLLYDSVFEKDLNKISHLLPLKDGKVINLKTKDVRERTPEDKFTFECPVSYTPQKEYPNSDKFFDGICKGDKEYKSWMLKWLGYCLTAQIDDRSFYVLWGTGRNGKSTLINIMSKILNVFLVTCDKKILIDYGKSNGATPELVAIKDGRFVVASELRERETLRSDIIKQITGGDALPARQLFCEQITIKPCCKLVLLTNEKPEFNFEDNALKDRLKFLPFLATFEKNKKYEDELLNEHIDELFSSIVDAGAIWWETRELEDPSIVKKETQEFFNENDTVGLWIENCANVNKRAEDTGSNLYTSYNNWTAMSGYKPISNVKFARELESRGFKGEKKGTSKIYAGIKVNA